MSTTHDILQRANELQLDIACAESGARNDIIKAAYASAKASGDRQHADLVQVMAFFYSCGKGDGTKTEIKMDDNRVHVTAGGSITGAAIGSGAMFEARDITAYNGAIEQSQRITQELKDGLKAARAELEAWNGSPAVKKAVLQNFENLTEEVAKEKPDKDALGVFWSALKTVLPTIPALTQVGLVIAKAYGLSL